jgi:hypothetical protein
MNILKTMLVLVLLSGTAVAQDWLPRRYFGNGYRHASTLQEGVLRGTANLRAVQGDNLIRGQIAYSMALDNEYKRAEPWWKRKELYQKHFEEQHPHYNDRYRKLLERADEKYQLDQYRDSLIAKGAWPKPKEPSMTIMGKTYDNYDEFRGTEDWAKMKIAADVRELQRQNDKLRAELQHRDAVRFQVLYDKLSYAEKYRRSQHLKWGKPKTWDD